MAHHFALSYLGLGRIAAASHLVVDASHASAYNSAEVLLHKLVVLNEVDLVKHLLNILC